MKTTLFLATFAVAGAAMAATGTKVVSAFIPSGLNVSATVGSASNGAEFSGLPVSGSLFSFDAVSMGDVPDDAVLTSITYSFSGTIWADWTVTAGTNPKVSADGWLKATGPDAGFSEGLFTYFSPVLVGTSGTYVKTPIPGGSFSVANADLDLFDVSQGASSLVSFTLSGFGSFGITGENSAAGSVTPFAGVEVTINYDWQTPQVPESSTYAAVFGLVGLVGFGWVRNRR